MLGPVLPRFGRGIAAVPERLPGVAGLAIGRDRPP